MNINMQPAQMDTETIKSVLVQGLWHRVNEAENSLKDRISTNKSIHLAVGTHSCITKRACSTGAARKRGCWLCPAGRVPPTGILKDRDANNSRFISACLCCCSTMRPGIQNDKYSNKSCNRNNHENYHLEAYRPRLQNAFRTKRHLLWNHSGQGCCFERAHAAALHTEKHRPMQPFNKRIIMCAHSEVNEGIWEIPWCNL